MNYYYTEKCYASVFLPQDDTALFQLEDCFKELKIIDIKCF